VREQFCTPIASPAQTVTSSWPADETNERAASAQEMETKMTMTHHKRSMHWLAALALGFTLGGGVALAAPSDDGPPPGPPPGAGHPGHHRPPEEAFTACASLAEGDSCTVTFPDHDLAGTCRKVPPHIKDDAGKLVCAPARPPR
jgi:hypothetical protein